MSEIKKVRRLFWVWEFDKEEKWLNHMAQNGWVLDHVGFCVYHFRSCEPGEYNVRLEMHKPDNEYIEFMEDTGAEYVGRMVQWIYWRKKTEKGSFDLFSDIDSRITHLDRICKSLKLIGIANILIGLCASLGNKLGWLNLLCAALVMYALGRIQGKKDSLQEKRILQE